MQADPCFQNVMSARRRTSILSWCGLGFRFGRYDNGVEVRSGQVVVKMR